MLAALQEDLKEILDKAVISGDLDKYKQFIDRAVRDILKTDLRLDNKAKKIEANVKQLQEYHGAVYEDEPIIASAYFDSKDSKAIEPKKIVKADTNREMIKQLMQYDGKTTADTNLRIDKIEAQTKTVATNEADIKSNTTNITSNTTNITNNSKNIKENKDKSMANTRSIDSNRNEIANNSSRISSLDHKMDDMKSEMNKGFAMSAAMSSVDFQTVKVGNLGVGFGVGSYENAQAVSLGLGVRPNEDTTLNVKGAMSTGTDQETMIGAGATYQFELF